MIIIGLPGFGHQDAHQREAAEWAARMDAEFHAHQPQPALRWAPAMDATPRPSHYRTPAR